MSVFGFSTEPSSGGGDFLPILKFDSRSGRLFRIDRVSDGTNFSNESVEITSDFKAVADFENMEVGWANFTPGSPPNFALVPLGDPMPPRPSEQHKNAVRFMVKLAKSCAGDKPVRELSGTAKSFLRGVEKAYEEYQAQRDVNAGKLPVIRLKTTIPVKTGTGDRASTNYQPIFEIVGWQARGDFTFQPRSAAVSAAKTEAGLNDSLDDI